MIEIPQLSGHIVAVLGLGRSGLAAARTLAHSGAEVWAWDDLDGARARARKAGVPLVNLESCDWTRPNVLILSPGVPLDFPAPHPAVARAREAGCEILGEVELLFRAQAGARFVGITGTNGKSTTTALIGHILDSCGMAAQIGANIGTPALALDPMENGGTYVLEMSSYQLALTGSVGFDVAVLLNLSPDHLDRHGGMARYVAAKRRIFRNQKPAHSAVIGTDDETTRRIYEDLKEAGGRRVVPISGRGRAAGGVYAAGGRLFDDTAGRAVPVADLVPATALPGSHNWQNAAAAFATARALGVPAQAIAAAIATFPGLPHRQELLAVIDGVRYVNDSKATNAAATARALTCYQTIYWIAGGRAKEGGLAELSPWLGRVVHAFLIGEAANAFAAALKGRVPVTHSGDLEAAVADARQLARVQGHAGAVVLLSPACASFDQFENFEARGDAFRALVNALPGTRTDPGRGTDGPARMATGTGA